MTKIANLNDFKTITSNITSFSHAYLLSVNSIEMAYPYAKDFAKSIILEDIKEDSDLFVDISYKIDHDEFDDLYIVNPETIGINNEEINKLLNYMETKSLRDNGRRVYIIYGFERLSTVISNKILKFLEEPEDNIYAILLTENYEKILPTIISRCQVMNFSFPEKEEDEERINNLKEFIMELISQKNKMIAYEYDYFFNSISDRSLFYSDFEILERIISDTLNCKYKNNIDSKYIVEELHEYSPTTLINILNITNKLKCIVKNNINLNLLLDRYIIEIAEELELCKK